MADDASISLYDTDFYLWTKAQAAALGRVRGDDKTLDYKHLAEEVEDLGVSERNKVRSWVRLIIEHLYKLHATRRREPVGHWIGEIGNFRADVENTLTPTIQRMVEEELASLHRKAAKMAVARFQADEPGVQIETALRWTWAEIMGEENDPLDRTFLVKD